MGQAYVGIITPDGLKALLPEEDDLVYLLVRRVYQKRPFRALCCWAVLPRECVPEIQHHIELGENHDALRALQLHAIHWGPIPLTA